MAHIEELEARMRRFEQALLAGLSPWGPQLVLLQTIPGIDVMGAAMLLVRIPLIVTDDSGIVTGHSGDRDRCHG